MTRVANVPPRRTSAYVAAALLLLAMPLAGFWSSYFGRLFGGQPLAPFVDFWVIHVHATLFLIWVAGLVLQTLLVRSRRAKLHMRLGAGLAALGFFAAAFGLFATIALALRRVEMGWPLDRAAAFLIAGLTDMIVFAGFLAAAVAYRRQPETHKRLMLWATYAISLVGAARLLFNSAPSIFGIRFMGYPWLAILILYSPILLFLIYDWLTRRRLHPASWAGLAVFAMMSLRPQFSQTEAWLTIGRAILRPFT